MKKLLFLLTLAGCSPGASTAVWEDNINGTRCILFDGYNSGGIACDFSKTVPDTTP